MRRLFVPSLNQDTSLRLDDSEELYHALKVLRLKTGDSVELVDGRGGLAEAVLTLAAPSYALFAISRFSRAERGNTGRISLACAIPKRGKMEDIIDKAAQLGVDDFFPLVTRRTEVRPRPGVRLRYQRVALSALKQSRGLWLSDIHEPVFFSDFCASAVSSETALFIPCLEGARCLLFSALRANKDRSRWIFMIGPEGDFTSDEVALAVRAGAVPVSLGSHVLRVDTAAITVMALARSLRDGDIEKE